VLLAGANPAETMPPFGRHLRRVADVGRLIVVDPRRAPTAEQASLHLAPAPGTDLALALGILHAVVAEGHLDRSYVDGRTAGFDQAWRPSIGEAVRQAGRGGARVAVASWLLAPGLFQRRLAEVGADVVAEPLGAHPAVAELVLRRYTEASARTAALQPNVPARLVIGSRG
jgi:anaerobic selenocysteine-containing dehydrogenase